jgi:hypothetical protein
VSTERRLRRSSSPREAAELYLAAERDRSHASALLISDGGRIVAASAASPRDLLGLQRAIVEQDETDRDHFQHQLDVAGRSLRLASLDARVRSVRAVQRDLARILAE